MSPLVVEGMVRAAADRRRRRGSSTFSTLHVHNFFSARVAAVLHKKIHSSFLEGNIWNFFFLITNLFRSSPPTLGPASASASGTALLLLLLQPLCLPPLCSAVLEPHLQFMKEMTSS